jgi:hypothetical protein
VPPTSVTTPTSSGLLTSDLESTPSVDTRSNQGQDSNHHACNCRLDGP